MSGAHNLDAQPAALLAWMQKIAPYGILTTDTQLRVQSWNDWLETHSGLAPAAVLGRPLFEIFPDLPARRLDEPFRRAAAGEVSVLSTALHGYLLPFAPTIREPGVPHMLQTARIGPLDSSNGILGTITVIEDVTQRELQAATLRRQHAQDRLLSWALANLLQSQDPLDDVSVLFPKVAAALELEVYFNFLLSSDGTELVLHASGGITAEQRPPLAVLPLGQSLCGVCATDRQPMLVNHLQASEIPQAQALKELGVQAYVAFPLVIGDRLLGTLSFATRKRDTITAPEMDFLAKIAQYVAIAMDRAERERALRHAQAILSEHASILEAKVTERTARLHETIAQLESFSYTVAHDLRAPIRALKGYCQVLSEDYSGSLPAGGLFVVERLARASDRLDALTRDLLKFSKISRQDVELTPIDLAEVVQDIVLLTPALQDDIVIVHPPLGVVFGQRTLLQQCFSNLFDNAVRFVTPGAKPRIVVRTELRRFSGTASPTPSLFSALLPTAADTDPAEPASAASLNRSMHVRLRVWIEDNGIGIAPEAHEKIFEIFERIGQPGGPEGTGIGLAIVARTMQQMSGACGVESSPGSGSRFWLDFHPAAPTRADRP